jgi:hypothetical protein
MKWVFMALILASCSPSPEKTRTSDYVLVEFAAKLEDDYEKNGAAALK